MMVLTEQTPFKVESPKIENFRWAFWRDNPHGSVVK